VRKALQLGLGIAVSGLCLYVALRGTEWDKVARALEQARLEWVLASVAVTLVSFLVRTERWRILLRPIGAVPFMPALSATAIGFGATMILPFRLGEIIRPALLARRERLPLTPTISSIVLERMFDMLVVISCFLVALLIYPELPPEQRRLAYLAAPLAVAGFVLLIVVQRRRDLAERVLDAVLARLPERAAGMLRGIAAGLLDGLEGLGDPATVVRVIFMSVSLWAILSLQFACGLLALGIDVPLLAGGLLTMVAVAFSVFLPQAPGFVGTWQLGCEVALVGIFHADEDLVVAYSLLTWVVQMVTNIAFAAIFVARDGLSIGEVLATEQQAESALQQEG